MSSSHHFQLTLLFTTLYHHCISQKYILVKQIKTVDDAETYCNQQYGTSLASIHSSTDNAEVTQLCRSHTKCIHSSNCQIACSIGANDKQNEQGSTQSGWQWTDGSSFNYWNWKAGEPNDWWIFPKGEDCALIWANNHPWSGYPGTWNDCPCDGTGDYRQWFLCNAPTSSPTKAPTLITTNTPTFNPSNIPTITPTISPSNDPTSNPTVTPTQFPTMSPSDNPTQFPSNNPTQFPSNNPTQFPSNNPTQLPSINPTQLPSINPTQLPSINPTVSPSLIVDVEMKLFVSSSAANPNEGHTHDSLGMETIYMFGGLFGGLVFLFLCMCCLLIIVCMYLWKQKQKNKLDNKNDDQIQIIHNTRTGQTNTESTIHEHHYYHHSVQLSEDVANTIQFNDHVEEGEETAATISDTNDEFEHDHILDDEKENIKLLGIISDDSDNELSGMYVQPNESGKSTRGFKQDKNICEYEDAVP